MSNNSVEIEHFDTEPVKSLYNLRIYFTLFILLTILIIGRW